jgi:GntR family transcriptional regulator, rspAB operon transcriptional repressor
MPARRSKRLDEATFAVADLGWERIDRTRQLREQIYAIVRRLILTGEFPSGSAIDEKAIALKLGVSRTPVREAVKELSDENLVEVKAQSATVVAPIGRKLIRWAFLIRRALEVESIGIAAEAMSKLHAERLEELNLLLIRAVQHKRYVEAISWDDAFHRYISEISDLPRLWQAIEISKAQLDRCRHLTVPKPGQTQATLARFVDLFLDAYRKPPREIVLDLDATNDLTPSGAGAGANSARQDRVDWGGS